MVWARYRLGSDCEEECEAHLGLAVALAPVETVHKRALILQPAAVYLSEPAALTLKAQDSSGPARVDLAIAVGTKSLAKHPNGLRGVFPVAAASVSIADVPVDSKEPHTKVCRGQPSNGSATDSSEGAAACYDFPHFEMLALPGLDMPVSLGISVTEQGHVGIDFDRRSAELDAISDLFGPAIRESVETQLDD